MDDQTKARNRLRAASARYQRIDELRANLHDAIRQALEAGVPVGEVAEVSGYKREHIRRIRKARDEQ